MSIDDKLFLVGLGAQKAGSTWLARYLGSHPEVYVSRLKELHYFDTVHMPRISGHYDARMLGFIRAPLAEAMKNPASLTRKKIEKIAATVDRLRMTNDPKYPYRSFFEERVTKERVFCDITPAYSVLDAEGFEAITKVHPVANLRVVFIMRDPVDRFWSAMRMHVRKVANFDPYERFTDSLADEGHVMRTDYRRTILELEKVVPVEQCKYLFYEDLFNDRTTGEVTDWLGIQRWPAQFDTVVNPGASIRLRDEDRNAAGAAFREVYRYVFDRFGDKVPKRWRDTAAACGLGLSAA